MAQSSVLLEAITDMLIDSNLFNNLSADEMRTAAGYFSSNTFNKGDTIFKEGDDGTFMCIVHEGRVTVIKADQNDKPVVMGSEGAGHIFGEMAVLDGERRSASCIAATDCTLIILSRDSMDKMLDIQPRVGAKVLRTIAVRLSRRMRMAAGKLVDFGS